MLLLDLYNRVCMDILAHSRMGYLVQGGDRPSVSRLFAIGRRCRVFSRRRDRVFHFLACFASRRSIGNLSPFNCWQSLDLGARSPANVAPGKAKIGGNYINSITAEMEAIATGADEALLLDARGFVAEGSGENLFFIRQGTLYAIEHSVNLMGITRDLGCEVGSVRATRDRLYRALAR